MLMKQIILICEVHYRSAQSSLDSNGFHNVFQFPSEGRIHLRLPALVLFISPLDEEGLDSSRDFLCSQTVFNTLICSNINMQVQTGTEQTAVVRKLLQQDVFINHSLITHF